MVGIHMTKSSVWQYLTIPVSLKGEAGEKEKIIKERKENRSSVKRELSDPLKQF